MQTKENSRRDFRIKKVGHACAGRIQGTETQQRDRRHARYQSDGEEIHDHETSQKQKRVNIRRQRQRGRNFLPPGQMRRVGDNKNKGKQTQRECRRIKYMYIAAFAVPAHILFTQKAQRDH